VIRTTVSVPPGRTADVQASWSGDLHPNVGQYAYCFGYFTIDGTTDDFFKPADAYQLIGGETAKMPNAVTVSMNGYRRQVGPGQHSLNVYINSAYAGCTIFGQALNAVINIS
jgi:hypothetical protein